MGRFERLVKTPALIELFKEKYHIPQEVSIRYCFIEGLAFDREVGEVIIPMIAFIEGGMTIPMETRAGYYLKSRSNVVKLISCLSKSNKGMKDDFLIVSSPWSDGLPCPTKLGKPGGVT